MDKLLITSWSDKNWQLSYKCNRGYIQ